MFAAMAYDELLEQRIRRFLTGRVIKHEAKRMMGGLCFMVDGKMCVGVEKNRLMARIGPEAHDDALTRKGCHPMDFTGRPMRGFVFIEPEGLESEKELAFWLELALAYTIRPPGGRRRKSGKCSHIPKRGRAIHRMQPTLSREETRLVIEARI